MERYTYFDGGKWRMRVGDTEYSGKETERLAAYEDTGLEPEEIRDSIGGISPICVQCDGKTSDGVVTEKCGYPDDITKCLEQSKHLCELAQAEKEGRLVVLPCKDWFEIVFGEQELFWGIDTDYIETPIREISVDNAERFTWYDGWKTLVLRGNDENGLDWEFSPEDIGKTVFLTREAAEAALEAMGGENNA